MAATQSPELARLFDICQRIEMAHARLYRALAEAHSAVPEIAALWRKTANEEEGHAAQFRLASSSYTGLVDAVRLDLTQATQMLDSVEATVMRLRVQPPGIVEALRTAIHMEEAMASLHMDQLASFKNPAHQKLFRAMMGADKDHVEALRSALAGLTTTAASAG